MLSTCKFKHLFVSLDPAKLPRNPTWSSRLMGSPALSACAKATVLKQRVFQAIKGFLFPSRGGEAGGKDSLDQDSWLVFIVS